MIANASPPVIVRCLSSYGVEKRAYFTHSAAKRGRRPGQHVYRCDLCGWLHLTNRNWR